MPTPDGVLWRCDPHTEAKHQVYERYLQAWFPILLQRFRYGVTYAEGFAGAGEYIGGHPGSPLIAVRAALASNPAPTRERPAYLLLVEKDRARLEHLREVLTAELEDLRPERLRDRGLVLDLQVGECEETLPVLLERHRAATRPMLAILDTWGSAVTFSLLRRLATGRSAEVIVTIQPQQFVRFAADPNHYGDRIFGPTMWRDVRTRPSDEKGDYIRTQYRRTVQEAGFEYVLDFELADERGNLLYLVYGTNHAKGVEKMKEAMWKVDPVTGMGYRDPRDPNQQTLPLDLEPDTAPLRRLLLEHLLALPGHHATVEELREFTLLGTIYKPGQAMEAIRRLLSDRAVRAVTEGRLTGASVVEALGNQAPLF